MDPTALLLRAFFVGWVAFAFSLVDVGGVSVHLLLLASVGLAVLRFRLAAALSPTVLALVVSGLAAFALSLARHPEHTKVYTHLGQYGIGLCALVGALGVDWERRAPGLRRFVGVLAAVVVAYGVYQLFARQLGWPGAFLPITNLQVGSDSGFQRGYTAATTFRLGWSRVSSFFPEPSDLGRFQLWVLAFGWTAVSRRSRAGLVALALTGIFVSQSLGGWIGAALVLGAATLLTRDAGRAASAAAWSALALAAFWAVFPGPAQAVFERFDAVLFQRDYLGQTRRFGFLGETLAIVREAPFFGHGLGAIKLAAPDQVITNNLVLLLIERGAVGTALFLVPFVWAGVALGRRAARGSALDRLAWLILVVEGYCLLTFGAIYFPPLYLAMGLAVARARAASARDRRAFEGTAAPRVEGVRP